MIDPARTSFITRLGYTHELVDDHCVGTAFVPPGALVPGTAFVRASVLGTYADVAAGMLANRTTAPRICMTVDLTVHVLAPPAAGVLGVEASILKTGRTTTVTETWFTDAESGAAVAVGHLTFVASPRPQDVMEFPLDLGAHLATGPPLDRPLADDAGLRRPAPGVAEVDPWPYVQNPTGAIQGGILALLAEVAAETVRPGRWVQSLDVRYLAATRRGPARATARVVGGDGDEAVVRVEVRDAGSGDRLSAVAVARTRRV